MSTLYRIPNTNPRMYANLITNVVYAWTRINGSHPSKRITVIFALPYGYPAPTYTRMRPLKLRHAVDTGRVFLYVTGRFSAGDLFVYGGYRPGHTYVVQALKQIE